MKSKHPRITLLGNNSGRNLGDAAILSSILESLSHELPDAEFYVPTIAPKWIQTHYGEQYTVVPLDAMPWTLSIRLLGLPTLWAIARSDLALICDGIIFGKKLFNPTFNYLITLIFLVPWARLMGCKLICYSCGIGPFPGYWSKVFARYVIQNSDHIIMREHDSKALAEALGVTKEIEVTGDAAFVNPVSPDSRAKEILRTHGVQEDQELLGINVTRYVDSWLKPEERVADKSKFLDTIAGGIKAAQQQIGSAVLPVIFSTQPMDEEFCHQLKEKVSGVVIDNSRYLSHDIQAVMRRCELLIGMRFHSVVLASAVEVPIIGLIYAPKVRGFMRLLDCEEYGLELKDLTDSLLGDKIASAWKIRGELRAKQKKIIDELKDGAHRAARTMRENYFPEYAAPTPLAAQGV